MATITLAGSDASAISPTTTQVVSGISAAIGDWLVVVVAATNPVAGGLSSFTSVTDASGNTYTNRVHVTYTDGSFNSGATLAIATCQVSSALVSDDVTANFSINTSVKAVQVYKIHPVGGDTISYVTGDTTGSLGPATNHSAATVSVALGKVIFGCASIETDDAVTGDSDTSNGSWSTVQTTLGSGGSDNSSQCAVSQYKVVSGTGNQSWACSTTSARDSARSYIVLSVTSAAFSLAASFGQYTLGGTAMTPKLGHAPVVAGTGSYTLTGTAATLINSGVTKTIAADPGDYLLTGTSANFVLTSGVATYFLTGTAVSFTIAHFIGTTSGSYALTGTDVILTKAGITNKVLGVDAGAYNLLGTDATINIVAAKNVVAEPGSYVLTGTAATPFYGYKLDATVPGSYSLVGTDVALSASIAKHVAAEVGSYVLTGTSVALTIGAVPPAVSPLHIGEWPVDKRKRRAREDARAREQRARDRFRRAIARLLEGLPPEFDEPADLDEALDSAVQASNLLYALSAPIREINAVNELIDHIRQLRIAQPIAQLHLAQAYNQAHRHLKAKAEEDTVMALLLGPD